MIGDIRKIKYAREAGQVQRCHTITHVGSYDVAQHIYGMLSMLFILCPNPSTYLVKAILAHDVAERTLGDIPRPAKWLGILDEEKCESIDVDIREKIYGGHKLRKDEKQWLRGLDMLEFSLWCKDQIKLGNRNVSGHFSQILKWFQENRFDLPPKIWDVYTAISTDNWERLDDELR